MIELYQKVLLNRNFPEYALKKGDVAIVVDTVPHSSGGEESYILEVFNDAEESVDTVVVPFSAVELCNPHSAGWISKVNNIFGKRNRGKTEYVDVQGLS